MYKNHDDGKIHSEIGVDAFLRNTHSKIVVSDTGTSTSSSTRIRTGTNEHPTFHSNKTGKNINTGTFVTGTGIGTGMNEHPTFHSNKTRKTFNTGTFDTGTEIGTGMNEHPTFHSPKKGKATIQVRSIDPIF